MRAEVLILGLLACLAVTGAQTPPHKADPDVLLREAIDAQQRGDYERAVRDYHELLKLRPNEVEARVNLGAALVHVANMMLQLQSTVRRSLC